MERTSILQQYIQSLKSTEFQELLLTQMRYMTNNFKTYFKLKPSPKLNIYKPTYYMFL